MRISDWSSDVCSSDLLTIPVAQGPTEIPNRLGLACAFTHGGINFLSRTAFLGLEFCKQLLGSRNVDFLDPILFHRRKRIIKLLEGCQPLLVACTELKSPFGELKASQRKIHDRMTREGHDHFGVAIPGGGFFRSEEHTSELQSLMRNSYAVFCL